MSNAQLAKQPESLRQILTKENMKAQFALNLPRHLTADRFVRCALTALTRTPKLQDCTPDSFMKCLLDLSAYGIEPDGRRAHLIPFGNECTLIIDWKGLAELAMRSGIIAKLHADIVCENDAFAYNMGEVTKHTINWKEPRGEMYAAYAMAQTKTGEQFYAVLSKHEIDGIRGRSRAGRSGPWVTDYNEMAKKTAFRRLAKWLPLSAEFRDAVHKEDDEEVRDVTPSSATSKLFTQPALEQKAEPPQSTEKYNLAYLMQDSSVTWPDIRQTLLDNGVIADAYRDEGECTPEETQSIVRDWSEIIKLVKGGQGV